MYLPQSTFRRILFLTLPGGIALGLLLYALIRLPVQQHGDPSGTLILALIGGVIIGGTLSAAAWLSLRHSLHAARQHATQVLEAELPPLRDRDPIVAIRQTVADAISSVPRGETLAVLAARLSDAADREAALAAVAETLTEHLAVCGAVLLLRDAERNTLVPAVAWGAGAIDRMLPYDIDGTAIGRALRERRVVNFSSVQMPELLAPSASRAVTLVSWPLWSRHTPLGVLCLIIAGVDVRLNAAQQQLLDHAARLFTAHAQTDFYRQAAEREQRRLSAFEEALNTVTEQPDLERALMQLLRIAADATDSSHGTFLLIDPEAFTIRTRITLSGGDMLPLNLAAAPILKHGLAGWVLRHQRGAIIDDIERDPRWIPSPGLEMMRSALAMPLFHGDRPLGVLTLAAPTPYRYSQRSLALVAALAAYTVATMVRYRYEGIVEPPDIAQARQMLSMYLPPHMIRDLVGNRVALRQALQPRVVTATVVCVCLRGLDRVSDLTVHQLIQQLVGPFHRECRVVVGQHHGAYVPVDERSFYAVFGFPQPRFDDATRALQAAQQIRAVSSRLRLQWRQQIGAELSVAVAVTSGQAATGVVEAEPSHLLVWTGSAIREARRLAQLARNDEIVVAEATLQQVQPNQFTFDPLAPVTLANGDEPMSLYRLADAI